VAFEANPELLNQALQALADSAPPGLATGE